MAFTVHLKPHHVHKVGDAAEQPINCIDHSAPTCTDDHWINGRPERDHPHHVEIDSSTGLVGYTRLTEQEIAERAAIAQEKQSQRDAADLILRDRHDIIRARAKDDPAFKALAEHLGVSLEEL